MEPCFPLRRHVRFLSWVSFKFLEFSYICAASAISMFNFQKPSHLLIIKVSQDAPFAPFFQEYGITDL